MFNANRSMNMHLACEFGSADRAMMFQQMQWACDYHRDRAEKYRDEFYHDGKWWMKDTDEAWERWGPWRSKKSWHRDKKWLRENGWIFVEQLRRSQWDQTCYIAVNEEKLMELHRGLLKEKAARDKVVKPDTDSVSTSRCGHHDHIDVDNVSNSSSSNRSTDRSQTIEGVEDTQCGINPPPPSKATPIEKTPAKTPKTAETSENDHVLAQRWRDEHLAKGPNAYKLIQPTAKPQKLAADFKRIRDKAGLNDGQMTQVFEWFLNDDFWSGVIIMPRGLLNQSRKEPGTRNIDRILRDMLKPLTDKAKEDQAIAEGLRRAEEKRQKGDKGYGF